MNKSEKTERLIFPAANRNQSAIFKVLKPRLTSAKRALEVASGSGQHIAYFASRCPHVTWQPSDIEMKHRQSIIAWTKGMNNVLPPIDLDATADKWSIMASVDIIFCANLIHIAPWNACLGLLARSSELLLVNGYLVLYGPFMEEGRHNSPSNAQFDIDLKARNPAWGIRDLSLIKKIAKMNGLKLDKKTCMPANNFTLFFQKREI